MKNKIDVESIFYNKNIVTTDEWHNEWECCPTQRDHDERAKQPKHQKKFKKIHPDHLEVNGVILDRDCECTETGKQYKKELNLKLTDTREMLIGGQIILVTIYHLMFVSVGSM